MLLLYRQASGFPSRRGDIWGTRSELCEHRRIAIAVIAQPGRWLGKQPADYHIWILEGTAPAFIREVGQLYEGGPIWRIEQISPKFSH